MKDNMWVYSIFILCVILAFTLKCLEIASKQFSEEVSVTDSERQMIWFIRLLHNPMYARHSKWGG